MKTLVTLPILVCLGSVSPAQAARRWVAATQEEFVRELLQLTVACATVLDWARGLLFPHLRGVGGPSASWLLNSFQHAITAPNPGGVGALREAQIFSLITTAIVRLLAGHRLPRDLVGVLSSIPKEVWVDTQVWITLQLAQTLDGLRAIGLFVVPGPSRDLIHYELRRARNELLQKPPGNGSAGRTKRWKEETDADRLYREERDKGGFD